MTKFNVLVSMEDRSYTRIHRVICGHSKDPGTETANSFCQSYFDTYYEARDFALARRRLMEEEKIQEKDDESQS